MRPCPLPEIADLRQYIAGLPDNFRSGPYGSVYRQRLDGLVNELATHELLETAAITPPAHEAKEA